MSLESVIAAHTEALLANTAAVIEQNEKLDIMLSKSGAAPAGDADRPTRKTRAKKEEKSDEDTDGEGDNGETETASKLSNDSVKKDVVAPWLSEFVKNENDPETAERKVKIKGALAKLVGKEGATVADVPADKLQRLVDWVEKQKTADNGFGAGRLTELPGSKKEASEDDEI
jgi:hypothetical protein